MQTFTHSQSAGFWNDYWKYYKVHSRGKTNK